MPMTATQVARKREYARALLGLRANPTDEYVRQLRELVTSADVFYLAQLTGEPRELISYNYHEYRERFDRRFKVLVNKLAPTRYGVYDCDSCCKVTIVRTRATRVCATCVDTLYMTCERCHTLRTRYSFEDILDSYGQRDRQVCGQCVHDMSAYGEISRCSACAAYTHVFEWQDSDGHGACYNCYRDLPYCEQCEDHYFGDSSDHPCNRNCNCQSTRQAFTFPIKGGTEAVESGEVVTVEFPDGQISEHGMGAIATAVWTWHTRSYPCDYSSAFYASQEVSQRINDAISGMDPTWQTKQGNLTKRVQKLLYKDYGVKATPELITKIGNIAKEHTSTETSFKVQFSRDLNASADHWYHGSSCWWGGYSFSRCRLKGAHGLGMRVLKDSAVSGRYYDHSKACMVDAPDITTQVCTGRVWLIPLDSNLQATPDTMQAHAYLAFNAYGNVDGFGYARIIAAMTGLSYRQVAFEASEKSMYVNRGRRGPVGYLIAPQATCEATDTLVLDEISESLHGEFQRKAQRTAA